MAGLPCPALPSLFYPEFASKNCISNHHQFELITMVQCSVCGKQMRPRITARIRRMTGGPIVCRSCALEAEDRKDPPKSVCEVCGEKIERRILQRILRARARGRKPPMMCRNCFLKQRQQRFPTPPSKSESLDVSEWECVKCGASLEPEEVNEIKRGQSIDCEYCGSTITIDLFK